MYSLRRELMKEFTPTEKYQNNVIYNSILFIYTVHIHDSNVWGICLLGKVLPSRRLRDACNMKKHGGVYVR